MKNVAKNVVKNEVKNEVVVNAVKENLDKKEEKIMENTLTFKLVRNSHDAIDVTFSDKPCREILNRLNEGFTKRSERFNWFNGVWSTFRFNKSKELDRVGKDDEMLECQMFIEKIISEPLTMTEEEAKEHRKEMIRENRASRTAKPKAEAKTEAKKTTKKASTKKETKKTDTKSKEAEALNNKINAYLKSVKIKRTDFDKMPEEAKALILTGMTE